MYEYFFNLQEKNLGKGIWFLKRSKFSIGYDYKVHANANSYSPQWKIVILITAPSSPQHRDFVSSKVSTLYDHEVNASFQWKILNIYPPTSTYGLWVNLNIYFHA